MKVDPQRNLVADAFDVLASAAATSRDAVQMLYDRLQAEQAAHAETKRACETLLARHNALATTVASQGRHLARQRRALDRARRAYDRRP